jgi:hypothetical protein
MHTRIKTMSAISAVTVIGVLGLGATAFAGQTSTKVTIKGSDGDYYGYVKSSKSSCESNRLVKVYKMKGSSPQPSNDQKIGSDIAQPNGPDGMWAIGNSGFKHGKFYARVKATDKCGGDTSKVIDG